MLLIHVVPPCSLFPGLRIAVGICPCSLDILAETQLCAMSALWLLNSHPEPPWHTDLFQRGRPILPAGSVGVRCTKPAASMSLCHIQENWQRVLPQRQLFCKTEWQQAVLWGRRNEMESCAAMVDSTKYFHLL